MSAFPPTQQQPVAYRGQTFVSQPVQQGPMVIPMAPVCQMNVKAIRSLGIIQIVLGVVTVGLGIGSTAGFSKHYWLTESGGGIWGGLVILVAGILGVCSAARPNSRGLNATNMAFCIITCVVVFIDGIMFVIGIFYYHNCNWLDYHYNYNYYYDSYFSCQHRTAGRVVYSMLVVLMAAEFFISLLASVYCCQSTSCCSSRPTSGVILQQQQQQPQYIMPSTAGVTIVPTNYPQQSYLQQGFPQQNIMMAPAMSSYPQSMQQTHITIPAPNVSMPGSNAPSATNVSYSAEYSNENKMAPPPDYAQ